MISLKDGIRSLVRIDFQGRVHKHFRGTGADERCQNEIKVLQKLEERGCPNVPRLLESNTEENYIVTTNCGRPVEDHISKKKSDSLFKELEDNYGIRHDDPEPRNVTYDDRLGRFCLIDFELAEILDIPSTKKKDKKHLTRLQWSSGSQQGRRHLTNQDSYLSCISRAEEKSQIADHGEALIPLEKALFAVSDGVGGNNGGEFASSLVLKSVRHLLEDFDKRKIGVKDCEMLLKQTNANVNYLAAQNTHAPNLSATFAGIFLNGKNIIWANVGDSRVYRYRDNKLTQLSNDHNFAFRQWKRGDISEMEYRMHPRRNQLFDCMGGGFEGISPEIGMEKWEPGDRYLICSDGIIDGLAERKLEYIMKYTEPKDDQTRISAICDELLSQAVSNDGSDDTTLVVLEIL